MFLLCLFVSRIQLHSVDGHHGTRLLCKLWIPGYKFFCSFQVNFVKFDVALTAEQQHQMLNVGTDVFKKKILSIPSNNNYTPDYSFLHIIPVLNLSFLTESLCHSCSRTRSCGRNDACSFQSCHKMFELHIALSEKGVGGLFLFFF